MSDDSHECPSCGKSEFKTASAMKIHHAHVHGESLATTRVSCFRCGEEDHIPDAWARKKERHFCSSECRSEWLSSNWNGDSSPAWKGGKETVKCDWCCAEFQKWPSEIREDEHHFCNRQCLARWHQKRFRGEGSPRWKGGWEYYGGENWREQRDAALVRDNHECVVCGAGKEEIGREPDVHHIRPRHVFVDSGGEFDHEAANKLNNLVVLCPSCHRTWEGIPLRPDARQAAD